MKIKVNIIIGTIIILATAIVSLASPWIALYVGLQASPNPQKPEITYGEFSFRIEYEMNGRVRVVNDVMICQFDGYNVDEGRGKTRKWKYHYKNEQSNEILIIDSSPGFSQIVLESMDQYKVTLGVANAEYFLSEPDYKGTPELPSIRVYDTNTGHYKDPTQRQEFLEEHDFKILIWYCDLPVENTFS